MIKQFQAGLSKFFTKKWIPIIILLVICFVLISYSSNKGMVLDRMTDYGAGTGSARSVPVIDSKLGSASMLAQVQPAQPLPMNKSTGAGAAGSGAGASAGASTVASSNYSQQQVANPSDLLPSDKNSQWAALNPAGGNVAIPDLLQAGYHIGLDTIGQTLKNPNYQLRSDPIIEKKDIGPWMQSTIEPDFGRVPLEVGYGQR